MDAVKLDVILTSINFFGALFLFYHGTFVTTKYFKISKFFISLYVISILFRLMHWEGSNVLNLLSLLGILILYGKCFARKTDKKILDYLKIFWVITFFIFSYLKFNHAIDIELFLIPQLLIVLSLGEYFRTVKLDKNKKSD